MGRLRWLDGESSAGTHLVERNTGMERIEHQQPARLVESEQAEVGHYGDLAWEAYRRSLFVRDERASASLEVDLLDQPTRRVPRHVHIEVAVQGRHVGDARLAR